MDLADVLQIVKRDLFDDISSFFNNAKKTDKSATSDDVVVAVTTMTEPQTFTGSAVLVTQTPGNLIAGGAVFASRTDSPGAAATSAATTSYPTDSTSATVTPSNTAVTSFTTPIYSTPTAVDAASLTSSLSNAQASAHATSSQNGGLSGGAKAGIAFGVLIPVAAILIGVLMMIRRRKRQEESMQRLDDEKAGMAKPDALPQFPTPLTHAPAPASGPAPMAAVPNVAVRSTDTLSAPRLSIRPQTQFDPRMSKLAGPNGAMAADAPGAGAAAAATASAWERPGAEKNANDPANPFGNHAETVNNGNNDNNKNEPVAAAAVPKRASSPVNIDAAAFPLPGSAAPSEIASGDHVDASETASLAPSNPATASNLSLIAPSTPTSAVAAAAAAAGAAAGAAMANKRNSPPPADNVYRVQLDFKPSMDDELEIRAGQLVRLLHSYDDGWALCIRMDRSQQGVVPRTCLSKNTVKPRQGPPPQGYPGGPGPRGPNSPMRGPGGSGPVPYGQAPRPMTPQGRNSPAPYGQPGRPMTPQGRPMTPTGRNSPAPGRPRAQSNAGPAQYTAYAPQGRSMSPGPYLQGPPARPDEASRKRSNSTSNMGNVQPPKPLSLTAGVPASSVSRKPVPGQAV
ncbi:uncharacterized protein PV09_03514 [Verruconis gallopava]|uniref:SH3 domain-containing protein n=1 Tax=Verruconis gallopava TaxID=253628 RepID=A0A0D1XSC0_9PEZI|nr:uncharacterized protein PV09_03514 [Verruconis gallopava]KIW05646.1 hypothetical protein PV09_03514 [Verruconis gallopava]